MPYLSPVVWQSWRVSDVILVSVCQFPDKDPQQTTDKKTLYIQKQDMISSLHTMFGASDLVVDKGGSHHLKACSLSRALFQLSKFCSHPYHIEQLTSIFEWKFKKKHYWLAGVKVQAIKHSWWSFWILTHSRSKGLGPWSWRAECKTK